MDQKPILCLDFDGVIHSYSSGWQGADVVADPPVDGVLDFILDAREHFTVAIHSSRSGKQGGVTAMQGWLMSHMLQHSQEAGGPRNFGTESIAEVIDSIHWATEKPPAMVTIDDRALTFTGVWPSMDALTSFKPWNKAPHIDGLKSALWSYEFLDKLAQRIFHSMRFDRECDTPEWQGGNSDAENEARACAMSVVEMTRRQLA